MPLHFLYNKIIKILLMYLILFWFELMKFVENTLSFLALTNFIDLLNIFDYGLKGHLGTSNFFSGFYVTLQ